MPKTHYTEDHEWIRVDGDEAVLGITNHAQEQLGDLVFVELSEVGQEISKGEAVIVVESVKAASDVYAPADGEVTAVNDAPLGGRTRTGQQVGGNRRVADQAHTEGCVPA